MLYNRIEHSQDFSIREINIVVIAANHLRGGVRGAIRNLNTDQSPEPINSAEPSQLSLPRTGGVHLLNLSSLTWCFDFHNDGRCVRPGENSMKTRSQRLRSLIWLPLRVAYAMILQMRFFSRKMRHFSAWTKAWRAEKRRTTIVAEVPWWFGKFEDKVWRQKRSF